MCIFLFSTWKAMLEYEGSSGFEFPGDQCKGFCQRKLLFIMFISTKKSPALHGMFLHVCMIMHVRDLKLFLEHHHR